MSENEKTRRLADIPDIDDTEDLDFREQKIVAANRVLPTTGTIPPAPAAPKGRQRQT